MKATNTADSHTCPSCGDTIPRNATRSQEMQHSSLLNSKATNSSQECGLQHVSQVTAVNSTSLCVFYCHVNIMQLYEQMLVTRLRVKQVQNRLWHERIFFIVSWLSIDLTIYTYKYAAVICCLFLLSYTRNNVTARCSLRCRLRRIRPRIVIITWLPNDLIAIQPFQIVR